MTAVVETFRKIAVVGDLKFISIQTSAAAATGHTIDLNTDISDGRGAEVKEILNTFLQDDLGTDVASCAFVPGTGIITLPTVVTGIHNLLIVAR